MFPLLSPPPHSGFTHGVIGHVPTGQSSVFSASPLIWYVYRKYGKDFVSYDGSHMEPYTGDRKWGKMDGREEGHFVVGGQHRGGLPTPNLYTLYIDNHLFPKNIIYYKIGSGAFLFTRILHRHRFLIIGPRMGVKERLKSASFNKHIVKTNWSLIQGQ